MLTCRFVRLRLQKGATEVQLQLKSVRLGFGLTRIVVYVMQAPKLGPVDYESFVMKSLSRKVCKVKSGGQVCISLLSIVGR